MKQYGQQDNAHLFSIQNADSHQITSSQMNAEKPRKTHQAARTARSKHGNKDAKSILVNLLNIKNF